jgi:hypothetical protein
MHIRGLDDINRKREQLCICGIQAGFQLCLPRFDVCVAQGGCSLGRCATLGPQVL